MSWALGRIFTQSIKNFLPGKLRAARLIKMNTWLKFFILNPLSANPKKWSNTLKQLVDNLVTNFLSVLDKFVGLALKGLRRSYELYTFNLGDKTVAIRNKIFLQLLKVCYSWLLTHSCCWSFSIPPENIRKLENSIINVAWSELFQGIVNIVFLPVREFFYKNPFLWSQILSPKNIDPLLFRPPPRKHQKNFDFLMFLWGISPLSANPTTLKQFIGNLQSN